MVLPIPVISSVGVGPNTLTTSMLMPPTPSPVETADGRVELGAEQAALFHGSGHEQLRARGSWCAAKAPRQFEEPRPPTALSIAPL
jgi:hypothetical protein